MKNMKYLYAFLVIFMFSCEEVIELDLNDGQQRLVIDASIDWEKGTDGKNQEIKLSLSSPYYQNETIAANGANVKIINSSNAIFNFNEINDTGIYTTTTFEPVLNETYTLEIEYMGQLYSGSETLIPASEIDRVEQTNESGFTGKDIEIKAFLKDLDTPEIKDYYFFEEYFIRKDEYIYGVGDDQFVDGSPNQVFSVNFYNSDSLKTGDVLRLKNLGCSKRYYQFMFLLLSQTADGAGGPFSTTPATVRGNIINKTNEANYPYGFFRLSETDTVEYTVTENGGTQYFNE